ncbi:MAG: hypothetical protein ISR65_17680 [Bacteriovoracaceae bacterium]|nr:hypothetical protein [Bacteriovoracaceae bacterium]
MAFQYEQQLLSNVPKIKYNLLSKVLYFIMDMTYKKKRKFAKFLDSLL